MHGNGPRPYIFMNLWGRCGAIFFHSLFDGHPDLSTIPGVAPYNVLAAFAQAPLADVDEAARFVASSFGGLFNDPRLQRDSGLDRTGLNFDEPLSVDPGRLAVEIRDELRRFGAPSLFAVSEALHNAFDRLNGRAVPAPKVFLQLHKMNIDRCPQIVEALPDRRGVLLVRAPLDNVESVVNFQLHHPVRNGTRLEKLYVILTGMLDFQYGPAFLDHRAIAVRLEDVKQAPERTMLRLCDFLGLDCVPSLFSTTQNDRPWRRPPTERNPQIEGFQMPSAMPGGYRLSDADRRIFALLFDGMRVFMGYPQESDLAAAGDLIAVLNGRPLDAEIALAAVDCVDAASLGAMPQYREFRSLLALHLRRPRNAESHLRCQRVEPA